jgi:type III secretion system OrgA/MxiK family protein
MIKPELLRIMYAPLDYIHERHFPKPVCTMSSALQQAVNHALIKRFSLSTSIDFSLQASDFSQRLVVEWKNISEVAWLLGCKLARGTLARNGQLATLSNVARRFVELPISCPAFELTMPVTKSSLEMHGARYLFLLQQQLPAALRQRMQLIFESDKQTAYPGCTLNRSLLTFAFDYAKNSSH